MGLVPPMTPASTESMLGQGMVPQATPHPSSLDGNLGLEPLDSLHHLPAMENMGYDQVSNYIVYVLYNQIKPAIKQFNCFLPVPSTPAFC